MRWLASWYDPGRFWSGDRIALIPPFARSGCSLPGVWSAGVWIGDEMVAVDAHRPTASRTLNSALATR
jgi:hypothetical protein